MPINDCFDGVLDVIVPWTQGKILFQAFTNGTNDPFGIDSFVPVDHELYSKSI